MHNLLSLVKSVIDIQDFAALTLWASYILLGLPKRRRHLPFLKTNLLALGKPELGLIQVLA